MLVLGSGPGGYSAAFRCADLGMVLSVHASHGRVQGEFIPYIQKVFDLLGSDATPRRVQEAMSNGEVPGSPFAPDFVPQQVLFELMLGGVFDRYPSLTIAFTEQNAQLVFTGGVPEKQGPWCTPRSLVKTDNYLQVLSGRLKGDLDARIPDDADTIERTEDGAELGPAVAHRPLQGDVAATLGILRRCIDRGGLRRRRHRRARGDPARAQPLEVRAGPQGRPHGGTRRVLQGRHRARGDALDREAGRPDAL